jgi:hypothetical protein
MSASIIGIANYQEVSRTSETQWFLNSNTNEIFKFYSNLIPGTEAKLYVNFNNWEKAEVTLHEIIDMTYDGYSIHRGRVEEDEMYLD